MRDVDALERAYPPPIIGCGWIPSLGQQPIDEMLRAIDRRARPHPARLAL
jgi:hypothetical protein